MRLPEANRSALGLLKVLLAASFLLPLLLFAVASWIDYRDAMADAQTELLHSSEVAREQASKVFDGQSQVADRVIARPPQVQSMLLVARSGQPLVSTGFYPVPAALDLGKHDYFQDFYRVLIGGGSDGGVGKVIMLVRDDGQTLARYPPLASLPPTPWASGSFLAATQAHPDAGAYQGRWSAGAREPRRLFAYRKVQGYPVYVVAGRNRAAIMAAWRRTMASHLVFGAPATLALFAVTWTALARTRREATALARARQEIERREQAEATLLKTQRLEAVGQMTGGVAHDFNNLLTVIMGLAELLGKRADDPARVRNLGGQIVLAAQRGGEVTRQLLAFSRRRQVEPEVVGLNRRLTDFQPLLERAASQAIGIELDLDPELGPVQLDPGHFEAAVLNLVGNARDAMPDGGKIVIRTRNVELTRSQHPDLPAGRYVQVAIVDSGTGMDPQTAAKAFEPFFTTKEIGKGTGLGLSQVYGFAIQAGGDVRITTVPDQGTTIELLLPRTAADATDERAGDPPVARRAADSEVILVVEDEPSVLEAAVENLRDLGYTTLSATDGLAALVILQSAVRVDVLFSDMMMPGGMNGIQLSVAARRLRPALKVLLTSGYAANPASEPPESFAMLPKPYGFEQLASHLQSVLRAEPVVLDDPEASRRRNDELGDGGQP